MSRHWRVLRIHHVAVAVHVVDEALAAYRALGLAPRSRERVDTFATDAALLPIGESNLELIASEGNAPLDRFLARRGPGLHHLALEVDDLDGAVTDLTTRGFELVEGAPKMGVHGRRVAFVHPRATGGVSVELIEAAS